ncbi:enoyl-CoA hydratase/isomerase family protein [Alkalihalobacterium chitinilyticum]|uniref:Enoyl-CoA hydratase/isomerase family protein n=1 Tax=Alkalihalobacterium chitinilyticum TaxID=2980103 RepID=A0ABT5VJM0_9BACI|nr:enoyl-CoA hydratase/isomerase family protein [Alkalihalobacterium chitinilyticum]MDE5414643.1 enoyl-CoA hydratase/isomerase family protein [Alkalihalobacterium chitinilyticum]
MEQKTVTYEVQQNVATISLNRPAVKNAINSDMHRELYSAFVQANEDSDVRVIVLTGSGDAFSSGADLKSVATEKLGDIDYGDYLKETYNKLLLYMDTIQKPTVAYINGIAVGAGLSLALACDFRIAEYDAKMGISFLKIGLVPDAGASYYLPRLVGVGKALEMSLGEPISAEEAYRIGLVHKIGQPEEFVQQLLTLPTTAYGLMKNVMASSYEHTLAEVLQMEEEAQTTAGKTKEHTMAVQRFLTK